MQPYPIPPAASAADPARAANDTGPGPVDLLCDMGNGWRLQREGRAAAAWVKTAAAPRSWQPADWHRGAHR